MTEKIPRGLPKLLFVQTKADIISDARQKGIEFMLYAVPGESDHYQVQPASILEQDAGTFFTLQVYRRPGAGEFVLLDENMWPKQATTDAAG